MFKFSDKTASADEIESIMQTLRKGWLAPGSKAAFLEKKLPEICGFNYGVLLNTRSSALFTIFLAYGIGSESNVLVSSISNKAHVEILRTLNSNIKFYAVEEGNMSCNYSEIRKKIDSDNIQMVILQNENLNNSCEKLVNEKIIKVIDLGYDAMNVGINYDAGVIEFDGICALAMFNNFEEYNSAICIRDWGRVGTQDEDVNKRYDGWVLGNNVRYDYKFVYGNLGFNFKSCEMSATLATEKLNEVKEKNEDFDMFRNKEGFIVSNNGYTLIVKNGKDYQNQLKANNIKYETIESYGYVLNEETKNNKCIFDNYIIINSDSNRNKEIAKFFLK